MASAFGAASADAAGQARRRAGVRGPTALLVMTLVERDAACVDQLRVGEPRSLIAHSARFAPTDRPAIETFRTMFELLDASSRALIGSARPRLLVIPLHDDAGSVIGGLWGCTVFQWLHVEMLFVPELLRGQGVGTALMASAETEARARGCRGAHVDTFSFQAAPFYRKLGFALFGLLEDFPPGHDRLFFCKRYDAALG